MAFIPLYDTNPLKRIRRPYVAWALLAANVAVYFFVEVRGITGEPSEASMLSLGLTPAVLNGHLVAATDLPAWSNLLTYAFLHGDFWHLAGNMIFLWVLADNVEDALGHWRYLAFYALCAIAAGYAYVLSEPASQSPVIGASGAIAGTVAAYLMLTPRAKMWGLLFARIPVHLSAVYVLGVWIVFQLFAALIVGGDDVAWWSHVGGLAAGAVLVVVMRPRGVPLFAPAPVAGPTAASEPPTEEGPQQPWQ